MRKLKLKTMFAKLDDFYMTNRVGKFYVFEGLRGVAVLMVFMVHVQNGVNGYFKEKLVLSQLELLFRKVLGYFPVIGSIGGHLGVDLFFVLSGFLIYRTLTNKNQSFLTFMWNRIRRLLPAHVFVILKSIGYVSFFTAMVNIFMLTDLFIDVEAMNFVTWTLTYELLFYILCAFWVIAGREYKFVRSWYALVIIMALVVISQYTIAGPLEKSKINLPNIRFLTFFYGVALSRLYYEHQRLWNKISKYFSFAVFPSLLLIWALKAEWGLRNYSLHVDFFRIQMEHIFILIGIAFFLLVAGLLGPGNLAIKKVLTFKPMRALGNVSYSFYLVHALITLPLTKKLLFSLPLDPGIKALLYIPLGFLVTMLVASFVFHYLEKPYFAKKTIIGHKLAKVNEKEVW